MDNTTKQTTITATIKLWAVPKRTWEITKEDTTCFTVVPYMDDATPYQKGCVELPYHAVVKIEAAPYDCTAEGIQALEAAKTEANLEHAIEIKQLDEKIANLTCLVQLDT